jgi:hypothetical protein
MARRLLIDQGMRAVLLLFVAGCAVESVPGDMDQQPQDQSPEINGTYLDVDRGVCVGGTSGAVVCSGNVCNYLEKAPCRETAGCYVALQDDGSFRACLPIDARESTLGDCASLTVRQCASREDCVSVFRGQSIFASFVRCQPE